MTREDTLPKIAVGDVHENEDGSANVELELDAPAVALLMQIGFETLLKNSLEKRIDND